MSFTLGAEERAFQAASSAGAMEAFLTGLMLLAGLILLAACANLGSLFCRTRRGTAPGKSALRLALGAGRLRILRQTFLPKR